METDNLKQEKEIWNRKTEKRTSCQGLGHNSRLAKSCGLIQTLANAYISLQIDSIHLAADEFRVNCKVKLAMYLFEEKDKSALVSNGNNRGSEGVALHGQDPYREGKSFQVHIVISSLTMVMEAINVYINITCFQALCELIWKHQKNLGKWLIRQMEENAIRYISHIMDMTVRCTIFGEWPWLNEKYEDQTEKQTIEDEGSLSHRDAASLKAPIAPRSKANTTTNWNFMQSTPKTITDGNTASERITDGNIASEIDATKVPRHRGHAINWVVLWEQICNKTIGYQAKIILLNIKKSLYCKKVTKMTHFQSSMSE